MTVTRLRLRLKVRISDNLWNISTQKNFESKKVETRSVSLTINGIHSRKVILKEKRVSVTNAYKEFKKEEHVPELFKHLELQLRRDRNGRRPSGYHPCIPERVGNDVHGVTHSAKCKARTHTHTHTHTHRRPVNEGMQVIRNIKRVDCIE